MSIRKDELNMPTELWGLWGKTHSQEGEKYFICGHIQGRLQQAYQWRKYISMYRFPVLEHNSTWFREWAAGVSMQNVVRSAQLHADAGISARATLDKRLNNIEIESCTLHLAKTIERVKNVSKMNFDCRLVWCKSKNLISALFNPTTFVHFRKIW